MAQAPPTFLFVHLPSQELRSISQPLLLLTFLLRVLPTRLLLSAVTTNFTSNRM